MGEAGAKLRDFQHQYKQWETTLIKPVPGVIQARLALCINTAQINGEKYGSRKCVQLLISREPFAIIFQVCSDVKELFR